jgi:hypothetical protein
VWQTEEHQIKDNAENVKGNQRDENLGERGFQVHVFPEQDRYRQNISWGKRKKTRLKITLYTRPAPNRNVVLKSARKACNQLPAFGR